MADPQYRPNRLIFAVIIAAGIVWYLNYSPDRTKTTTSAPSLISNAGPAANIPPMPAVERSFIDTIESAEQQYSAADTDFRRGALRPIRAKAICDAVSNPQVNDWIGTVTTLSTNGDGKGVLSVAIGDNLSLKTWNNSLSDVGDHTLVEPGTATYASMGSLREGDIVRFSGAFIGGDTDCFRESSLTMEGSMTEPAFVFRFSKVSKP